MEWKKIKGYEDIYEVSEYGDVRSIDRVEIQPEKIRNGVIVKSFKRFRKGQKVKPNLTPNRDRYLYELNKNGVKKIAMHRIVYEAFVGDLKDEFIIHHKDCNPMNNHYSNLEQMDYSTHNTIHKKKIWNTGIKKSRKHDK